MPALGEWPPSSELGGAIWRAQRAIERAVDARLAGLRLTSTGFRLLRQLAYEPGQSAADLARRLGYAPQSIALTVNGAVAQGLVERRPHPWHGRVQQLHLTDEGRAAYARGQAAIDEFESALGAGLDPATRETLWRGLRLVADRAEQVS